MRALIVDDEESSRVLLGLHLDSLGVTDHHVAEDGRLGLQMLESLLPPPDVIFLDVFMPDTDGFETILGLQDSNYRGGVVLISGGDMDILPLAKTFAKGSKVDLWGTLVKPLGLDDVAQVLRPHLGNK